MNECNKIRFVSRAEANQCARRMARENNNGQQRAYECETCGPGVWHLTSQSASEARQARRRRRRNEGERR